MIPVTVIETGIVAVIEIVIETGVEIEIVTPVIVMTEVKVTTVAQVIVIMIEVIAVADVKVTVTVEVVVKVANTTGATQEAGTKTPHRQTVMTALSQTPSLSINAGVNLNGISQVRRRVVKIMAPQSLMVRTSQAVSLQQCFLSPHQVLTARLSVAVSHFQHQLHPQCLAAA